MTTMAKLQAAVVQAPLTSAPGISLQFTGLSGQHGGERADLTATQPAGWVDCDTMAWMPLESLLYHVLCGKQVDDGLTHYLARVSRRPLLDV